LRNLFTSYLRPKDAPDIPKSWGQNFKDAIGQIPKKNLHDESMFIMDIIIYYLYYDIITNRSKYPKNVPFVDLPIEMIDFLIKKV